MQLWQEAEARIRRDDVLDDARNGRLARLASTGQNAKLRVHVARAAQAMSDALAALARSLRNGETA
jgi:hypothetical protein